MSKLPSRGWYKAMDIIYITEQIEKNQEIQAVLGNKTMDFISWASEMMGLYGWLGFDYLIPLYFSDPNKDFEGVRKRLYQTNVKEWLRIAKAVFERDGFTCQYCGAVGGILEVDHIVPFSYGGTDDMTNLATSCRKCNRQKKDKSVDAFIRWKKGR